MAQQTEKSYEVKDKRRMFPQFIIENLFAIHKHSLIVYTQNILLVVRLLLSFRLLFCVDIFDVSSNKNQGILKFVFSHGPLITIKLNCLGNHHQEKFIDIKEPS